MPRGLRLRATQPNWRKPCESGGVRLPSSARRSNQPDKGSKPLSTSNTFLEGKPKMKTLHLIARFFAFALLAYAVIPFVSTSVQSLTCRTDTFGTTRCSDGTTYRTDSFGTTRDNKGNSWRTDSFGTTRGSNGSQYRTDSFGTTRDNQGNSWRTDSFGTTRGSNGTTCRADLFGTVRCY